MDRKVSDIADVPGLLLRREGVFSSIQYLPEWSFWFYVAEREGAQVLQDAEDCARFFVENYVGLDKRPPVYREMERKYLYKWWKSIPKGRVGLPGDFKLIDELEATFVGAPRISCRRPRKRQLVITMAGAKRKSPRMEIDVGDFGNPLNFHAFHPLTSKPYWPEWFLGYFGTGQLSMWNAAEIYQKLMSIRNFCVAFLPVFAACTRAKPPTPYDEVQI